MNALRLGIQEPAQSRAGGDILAHFLLQQTEPVGRGPKFEHKVRAERKEFFPVSRGEILESLVLNPGDIGRANSAIRQDKTRRGTEEFPRPVCFGPGGEIMSQPKASVPTAGAFGTHHKNVSVGGSLDAVITVGLTKFEKLISIHLHRWRSVELDWLENFRHTQNVAEIASSSKRLGIVIVYHHVERFFIRGGNLDPVQGNGLMNDTYEDPRIDFDGVFNELGFLRGCGRGNRSADL